MKGRIPLIASLVLFLASCDAGAPVPTRPKSYEALRFEAAVPQGEDFTCGAASMATMLTFYWHRPTTEAEALSTLRVHYSDDELKQIGAHGLSFDDLVLMARSLGFSAEGMAIAPDELAKLAGPVIVHLDKGSFQHFVVLRRVGDGVFYVSDPVVGELTMSSYDFRTQYTGHALAVWKPGSKLPVNTVLTAPRDGIRVSDTLRRVIDGSTPHLLPGL